MFQFLASRVDYEEIVTEDAFTPSHPLPYAQKLKLLPLILGARRDYLSIWFKGDYTARTTATRILKRQVLIVNNPEHVKHVMASNHDNYERKTPQMRRSLEGLLGDGLFISDGETWKQRRPLVSDIVHKRRLPVFGQVMQTACQQLIERWAALPPGQIIDGQGEMAGLTAEIISKSVFGNDLGPEKSADVVQGFGTYQRDIDSVNVAYFMGNDEGKVLRPSRSVRGAIAKVQKVIQGVVKRHLAGEGDHNSMVEALIQTRAKNPHLGLTEDAVLNEAATIFMAGYETTAGTLTWALYCLAKSPWAEKKIIEEIGAVCGSAVPTVEDVPRLDYCRAVIDETLRLFPPVPILGRQAKATDKIGKLTVEPAGLVLVVPWLLHRIEKFWPEPNRFRPERFLEGRPVPYAYIPFASGPRTCPGLSFGHSEATLCLAMIMQRFHVRVAGDKRVDPICRLTLRPKGGMPLLLEPR